LNFLAGILAKVPTGERAAGACRAVLGILDFLILCFPDADWV
jgi:hypothetical protein